MERMYSAKKVLHDDNVDNAFARYCLVYNIRFPKTIIEVTNLTKH